MTDITTLALALDSSQISRGTAELNRLVPAAAGAERATERASAANVRHTATSRLAASATELQTKALNSVTGALRQYAAALAPAAVAYAFVRNTIDSQKALTQLEAALKSTNGVVGMTVSQLTDLAEGFQKVTPYEDDAIVKAEALLLTFKHIGGAVFPKALESILNVSTAMGTDLQSATIQVGKALNDPVLGLTALSRAGIQFNDTQKELIKGFVQTGDLASAQAIIQKELTSQFGNSARAARGTLGGALQALQNSFGNLFEVSKGGSENLRGSIEDLIALLDDPATQSAVQGFGAWLFDGVSDATQEVGRLAAAWRLFKAGVTDPDLISGLQKVYDAIQVTDPNGLGGNMRDHGNAMLRGGMFGSGGNMDADFYNVVPGPWGNGTKSGAAGGDGTGGGGISEDLKQQLQERLDTLNTSLLTEQQAEQNNFAIRMADLVDFNANRLISDQEYADLSTAVSADHATKMKAIQDDIAENQRRQATQQLSSWLGIAGSISDSLGSLFGESKEFAIASALINVAESITKTYAQYGWTPIGIAASAAAALAGAAQIAAITRSNPGSSGSLPSATGGGGAATAAPAASAGPSAGQTLFVSGISPDQIFTGQAMRDFAEKLVQFQRDGGKISLDEAA